MAAARKDGGGNIQLELPLGSVRKARTKKTVKKKNYYCFALERLYQALTQKGMTGDDRNHVLLAALLLLDGNSEEFKNTAKAIGLDKGDVKVLSVLISLDAVLTGKDIKVRENIVLSKDEETKILQTIYESPRGKTFDNSYHYDNWTDYTVSRYCFHELKLDVSENFVRELRKQYNLDYVYIPSRDDIDLEVEMDKDFKDASWRDKVIIEAYREEKLYGFVYPPLMARKFCKNGTFALDISCAKGVELLRNVFHKVQYVSVCRNIDAIEKPSVAKTEFPKELEKKILQRLSDFHELFGGKEIPQELQKEEIPEIQKQSQKPKTSDITKSKPKDLDLETLTDEEAEELQSALNRKDISEGCRKAIHAMLDCRVKQISVAARSNQVSELKLRRLPGYYRRDGLEEFLKRDFERTRQIFDSKDEKRLLKILKKSPKESNLSEKDWSEELYDKFCKREKLKVQKFHSFTRRHFLDAVYFHAMPKDKKEKEKYKASVEKKLMKKLEDMGEGKRWFKNSFDRFLVYEKTYGYVPKIALGKCIASTDHTFEQEEEGFVRFLHDIGYSLVYRNTQKYSEDKIKGNLPKLKLRDRKKKVS